MKVLAWQEDGFSRAREIAADPAERKRVSHAGGDTVYYGPTNQVSSSVNDGELKSGEALTLEETIWVVCGENGQARLVVAGITDLTGQNLATQAELGTETAARKAVSTKLDNLAIFNVIDYGAVGDGETDDTAAIKEAVEVAEEDGGFVFFPEGTYLIGTANTITASNVTLIGAGIDQTYLKGGDPEEGDKLVQTGPGRVEVRDLTITGPGDVGDYTNRDNKQIGFSVNGATETHAIFQKVKFWKIAQGVAAFESGEKVRGRVTVEDCVFDGGGLGSGAGGYDWSLGIFSSLIDLVTVRRCTFTGLGSEATETSHGVNNSHCIYLTEVTPLLVVDCEFRDHIYGRYVQVFGGAGENVPDVWRIENCRFYGASVAGSTELIQTSPTARSVISECLFDATPINATYWIGTDGEVLMKGCTFDGDNSGSGRILRVTSADRVELRDCYIGGDATYGVIADTAGATLRVWDCRFDAHAAQIYVTANVDVDVRGSEFELTGTEDGVKVNVGAEIDRVRISDSYFKGEEHSGDAIEVDDEATTLALLMLRDNHFDSMGTVLDNAGTITSETYKDNVGLEDK